VLFLSIKGFGMPDPIIECVPNFSEGRRRGVIAAIVSASRSVPGVCILDRHSDSDHNRTVLTMAGSPDAMEQGAFAAVACAAQLIDLRQHTGAHPRIGAADVVPFIPLQDTSTEECIRLAYRLGERVGTDLGLPVYYYEAAARKPERRNLAAIRKGQFEGLAAQIGKDPARKPDAGPATIGPAGAVAIGVRGPLIAFNIFLKTPDVEIARRVAAVVRSSSGGLPCVKALGLLIRNRAQVSMNLIDFHVTSLEVAFAAVRDAAANFGVSVLESEIVGLLPAEALRNIDPAVLLIRGFGPDRILENRLGKAGLPIRGFVGKH
jgi:glutamate formiminotransferase